jgi:peptidoglycan/LPS O-acetylase OafA/YrhL
MSPGVRYDVNMQPRGIYFPGLNGIRTIAAIIVVVFHTDQWSHYFGLDPIGFWKTNMHAFAVTLFFVLSGFLITYLLITEKKSYGKVNYKSFYIRRILRIWPVYYLVLFVGTIALIAFHFWTPRNLSLTFLFHLVLIPNLVFNLGFKAELIGILWSIGAEEQFYAFWPFFVNRTHNMMKAAIIFICVFLTVKCFVYYFITWHYLTGIFDMVPFEQMAIGAVAACLYISKSKVLQILYSPVIELACWIFLISSVLYGPVTMPFVHALDRDLHAVIYAIIILNVSTNKECIIKVENRFFNYLGKISYGIYAYHFIVLVAIAQPLKPVFQHIQANWAKELIMFLSVLGATTCVAHLSFKYFEAGFLALKKRFTLVKSRNSLDDNNTTIVLSASTFKRSKAI